MSIIQKLCLDTVQENRFAPLVAKQYDVEMRNYVATIVEDGKVIPLGDYDTATFNIRRYDETQDTFGATIVENTVSIVVPAWGLAVPGMAKCSVSLFRNGMKVLTTTSFGLYVQPAERTGEIVVYTAPSALAAGTYYITIDGSAYHFTTTRPVPAGGNIAIKSDMTEAYTYDEDGEQIESAAVVPGTSGTQLPYAPYVDLINRIILTGADVKSDADRAEASADAAAQSANAAAEAAVSAAMSEDTAQEYAENAEASAQTAAANANSTLGYKNGAVAAKNGAITAQTAAEAAQTAAEAAQTAAEAAQTAAETASTTAEAAQTAADAAANAANAAAYFAARSENNAQEYAENAEARAQTAAAYANSALVYKNDAVAAKNAAVDAKEYIEGVVIDIGEWYHYNHTSDATYSANFLKTGSTINNWSDATAMRSSVSTVRTVGDDLYIFAFGYKWTRDSMAMLPMEVSSTVEQLYRRFLINDKVVTYGVRESFTKDIFVVSFGYTQGEWFYTNTRMDGSKIEVYWNDGSLDFSSFVVRYSNAATPYADDVNLDDDTLKAIQSKLDISTKLSELDTDTEHRTVTDAEKAAWNAKSNFSGFYYDLIGKPSIPNKLSSLEQDSTHRTVTDAEKAIWNSQSAPLTSNLLKGDGRGGMIEATPGRDYVDYNRDVSLSMVKSSYTLTSRTNFSVLAGDTTKIGGGTLLLNGYQKIETETPEIELTAPEIKIESPSATLNGVDIATVDDIPTSLSNLSDDADHRTVTDDEKSDWNEKANKSDVIATAGNWYHYDWNNRGILKYDYLIDGSTITDWDAATSLPSFRSPALTLGADLFTIIYQLEWSRAEILELRPQLIEIYNLLKEHELLSVDAVIYTVRSSFVEEPVSANFGKLGNSYHFIQTRYDGSQLIAEWNEGAADFSSFQVYYSSYPYADDVELDDDTLEAIQSKLEIPTKLSELEQDSTHRTVTNAERSAWNAKYAKPVSGIPQEDLASAVQASLEKADSAPAPTAYITYADEASVNITLADNTEYTITNCASITLAYPTGRYEAFISVTFGTDVSLTFPAGTKYIGDVPTFAAGETWEISVKNGVVVAGKVE